ncbi:MAG: ATP-binding cassette domain-containing protein, partial [Saccharofermentans sp.]|nr:ATP-binding cassette domain-containing protein [Saccharofermentans sp.]
KKSIDFEVEYSPWSRALYLTFGIGTAAVLALSAYLYVTGAITDVYMAGMALFLFDVFVSIKSYYGQMARLTVTSASLDRIEEVFAAAELKDDGKSVLGHVLASDSEIEYDNVGFAYTDKDVLSNVSFTVKQGEMTALVGPSGGGKSTIASLLARFWDVKSGKILVRGEDIRDVSLGSLMDQISMVFQRVYLFQDTVYNNIAIGRPDATREEVEEAAKKARCYDFIMQLPDGFDTVIGEGGASLSGGEQQRISIARCILKDSPIVILDEATASVDADNERAIQEAISELCKDKTLLVIAHRLRTIRDADQILVVSDGKINERGNHETLMAQNGTYAHMVMLQET